MKQKFSFYDENSFENDKIFVANYFHWTKWKIKNKEGNQHANLFIESFKFIELLSFGNVKEFTLCQWIFTNIASIYAIYKDIRETIYQYLNKMNQIDKISAKDEHEYFSVDERKPYIW